MSDGDRILKLLERLREIERRSVPAWQMPILEVARRALEAEISKLARRIHRWNPSFPRSALAFATP